MAKLERIDPNKTKLNANGTIISRIIGTGGLTKVIDPPEWVKKHISPFGICGYGYSIYWKPTIFLIACEITQQHDIKYDKTGIIGYKCSAFVIESEEQLVEMLVELKMGNWEYFRERVLAE